MKYRVTIKAEVSFFVDADSQSEAEDRMVDVWSAPVLEDGSYGDRADHGADSWEIDAKKV